MYSFFHKTAQRSFQIDLEVLFQYFGNIVAFIITYIYTLYKYIYIHVYIELYIHVYIFSLLLNIVLIVLFVICGEKVLIGCLKKFHITHIICFGILGFIIHVEYVL